MREASRACGFEVDLTRLHDYFAKMPERRLVKPMYVADAGTSEGGLHKNLLFLALSGYDVDEVTYAVRDDGTKVGNMQMLFTHRMHMLAYTCEHLFVVTNDGVYAPVMKDLKLDGKRFSIISTVKDGIVSRTLRDIADFIEIARLKDHIAVR